MTQTSLPGNTVRIKVPPAFKELVMPFRYKSYWGGRGGAKSWSFARVLVALASQRKMRVLCCREYQTSIRDSVHKLLSDQINSLELDQFFKINKDAIYSICGSEFVFRGLHHNAQEIKSLEGIDVCWVEEAQSVSDDSWSVLIPTIRKERSEIWLSWNTGEIDDPTYKRFVLNPPDDAICRKVSYRDNPGLPDTLNKERLYLQRVDPDAYDHIWEGEPLTISEARIFKGKFVEEEFEADRDTRFYYGADWGFSTDPTTLVRSFIIGRHLYIDHEAYGVGVELDEIPALFDSVPGSREWKIKADSSRPDTISYIKRQGFNIVPCAKWGAGAGKEGSIKEGITYLKNFEMIHIHPRCKHTLQEFKTYSYKTDRQTNEVLPIIIDANNHIIDALRYSFDQKIKGGINWADFVG